MSELPIRIKSIYVYRNEIFETELGTRDFKEQKRRDLKHNQIEYVEQKNTVHKI